MAIDRRKFNRPPPNPKALDEETVHLIDEFVGKKVPYTKIGRAIGVGWRTVSHAHRRMGAYKDYPRRQGALDAMG